MGCCHTTRWSILPQPFFVTEVFYKFVDLINIISDFDEGVV